jgi:DNA modification methylase
VTTWDVITGDCLEAMRGIAAGSVDAVITDPPYGVDFQSARRTDKATWKPKIANDRQPFIWWLWEAARVIKPGGALLCFCRWDVAEAFRLAIRWAGFSVRAQIVWDRMAHGAGDPAVSPAPQHDLIWYATKGRRTFKGKRPKSVVRAMRIGGAALAHPNEKPLTLMASLVESYTSPGETVLDPFTGSGPTGEACVRSGRNFVGVELDAKYADIARRRITEAAATLFTTGPA